MPIKNYSAYQTEDRRLVILRVLQESGAFTTNEYMLQSMLERLGHAASGDLIRTDLAWLSEQGLIDVDVVADVHIAKLLARGEDVARGRTTVPGVKRPSPDRGA